MASSIRTGQRSANEVVQTYLDRIEKIDPSIRAFLRLDPERARSRAGEIDSARARGETLGPLAGVPLALKDNICTTEGTTTCGSRILERFESQFQAHVVERLESAGAIIVGKCNLDEFAMGSSTEHSAFATTHNPWDLARVAGGSSGGPAAAVAVEMVPGALGSDTGGSVRQPASFCGVVGLKPTYGRVSRYGLIAYGSSLDQIGPLGGDVRDIALLLGIIAGHDRRDSTSVNAPVPDYVSGLDQPVGSRAAGFSLRERSPRRKPSARKSFAQKGRAPFEGLRIGISDEYFGAGLNDEVGRAVRAAVDLMTSEGAEPVSIDLPHMKYAVACYYIIAAAEASANLARYDGVHYGYRPDKPKDIIDLYSSARGEGFGPEVKRRIMLGTFALSSGYYDAYYLKALKVRTLIKRDFDKAFQRVDLIASPVAPTTAFRIGEKLSDPLAMYLTDIYTISANLAGICAISLPCGFDGEGLPIGLQLMGPAFGEEQLLAAAHQYQLCTDHHTVAPPVCVGGERTP